jgi:hypothetical protein
MKRGFGSPNYNADRAKKVRQMGARALRDQGKAHRWTPGPKGTATVAGQKGGERRSQLLEQQQDQAA